MIFSKLQIPAIARAKASKVKLRILSEAQEEAQAFATWYDDLQIGLGDDFLDDLLEALKRVESDPDRYPKLNGVSGVKILPVTSRSFPDLWYGSVRPAVNDFNIICIPPISTLTNGSLPWAANY